MIKRVWNNLEFILTNTNTNEKLHLGERSFLYPSIANSEEMFSTIMSINNDDEGREIPIILNLKSMLETSFLNNFLDNNAEYDLQIIANGLNYYTKCKVIEGRPERIDNLYGNDDKCIIYNITLQLLDNRNYFETDPISTQSIGSVIDTFFKLGVSYPLEITQEMLNFPPIKSEETILDNYQYHTTANIENIILENNIISLTKVADEEYRLKINVNTTKLDSFYNCIVAGNSPIAHFPISEITNENIFDIFQDLSYFFDVNSVFVENTYILDLIKENPYSYPLIQGDDISVKYISNLEEIINNHPEIIINPDTGEIDKDKLFELAEYKYVEASLCFLLMVSSDNKNNLIYNLSINLYFHDLPEDSYSYLIIDYINIRNKYFRKKDTCICTKNIGDFLTSSKESFNYLKLVQDGYNLKIKSNCYIGNNHFYITHDPFIENYFEFKYGFDKLYELIPSSEIISSSGEPCGYNCIKVLTNQGEDNEQMNYIIIFYYLDTEKPAIEEDKLEINITPQKNYSLISEKIELQEYYIISNYKPLEPVLIYNNGGDNIGFECIVKPNSPIINPTIYNITTGLSMTLFVSIKATDTLIIDTRNKSVSVNGVYYENVKKIQDNWLKLELGYNTLKFGAQEGGDDADIYITYRKKVRGL